MLSNLKFRPYRWLSGGHAQTIFGHLLKTPDVAGSFEKILVALSDGDQLTARYYQGRSNTIVVLFHGLGGSADSSYMKTSAAAALQRGDHVLMVNHRGAAEGFDVARKIYHSGVVDDVAAVIKEVRRRWPNQKVVAIGFSLSANLLLNVAGMIQGEGVPDAIVAVNPPIDLHATAKCLLMPQNFVYDQKFVIDLKNIYRQKVSAGHWVNPQKLPSFCRLTDFDDRITAPMAGFKSRKHYYDDCSSARFAKTIQVPTIILTAEDDPFIPGELFRQHKFSSSVRLILEKHGGHVGYLGENPNGPGPTRWLSAFIPAALNDL